MGTISVTLPSDGQTADVADVNTPITTIVTEINGNLDNDNIKANAGIAGTKLADGAITGEKLATSAIKLGYASITSNATTTATSAASISLGTTVTIPAGGRSVKITAFGRALYHSTAGAGATISIWDGTVGSGTQLSAGLGLQNGTGTSGGMAIAVVTPSAGSKTYNVGLHANQVGTATLEAAATYPAFILVEAI